VGGYVTVVEQAKPLPVGDHCETVSATDERRGFAWKYSAIHRFWCVYKR
jgi:hypothetical protein